MQLVTRVFFLLPKTNVTRCGGKFTWNSSRYYRLRILQILIYSEESYLDCIYHASDHQDDYVSKIYTSDRSIRNIEYDPKDATPTPIRYCRGLDQRMRLLSAFCNSWKSSNHSSHSLQEAILYSSSYPTCQNKIEPSDPPLHIKPSCCGCHAMTLVSFLCPRNTCISVPKLRISYNLIR